MTENETGKVIHYYDKAMVAVVRLSGDLALGDTIRVEKGDAGFEMKIASMQIDHEPVQSAKKGDEVAIKVDSPVKEGAVVSKIVG